MTETDDDGDRPHADAPRVVQGTPSDEEIAAVTAVLEQIVAERATAGKRLEPPPAAGGWARTRRAIRTGAPLPRSWETR